MCKRHDSQINDHSYLLLVRAEKQAVPRKGLFYSLATFEKAFVNKQEWEPQIVTERGNQTRCDIQI